MCGNFRFPSASLTSAEINGRCGGRRSEARGERREARGAGRKSVEVSRRMTEKVARGIPSVQARETSGTRCGARSFPPRAVAASVATAGALGSTRKAPSARREAKGERRRTHQEAARKGSRSRPTSRCPPGRGRVALRREASRGGGSEARRGSNAHRERSETRVPRVKRLDRGADTHRTGSRRARWACTAPGPGCVF